MAVAMVAGLIVAAVADGMTLLGVVIAVMVVIAVIAVIVVAVLNAVVSIVAVVQSGAVLIVQVLIDQHVPIATSSATARLTDHGFHRLNGKPNVMRSVPLLANVRGSRRKNGKLRTVTVLSEQSAAHGSSEVNGLLVATVRSAAIARNVLGFPKKSGRRSVMLSAPHLANVNGSLRKSGQQSAAQIAKAVLAHGFHKKNGKPKRTPNEQRVVAIVVGSVETTVETTAAVIVVLIVVLIVVGSGATTVVRPVRVVASVVHLAADSVVTETTAAPLVVDSAAAAASVAEAASEMIEAEPVLTVVQRVRAMTVRAMTVRAMTVRGNAVPIEVPPVRNEAIDPGFRKKNGTRSVLLVAQKGAVEIGLRSVHQVTGHSGHQVIVRPLATVRLVRPVVVMVVGSAVTARASIVTVEAVTEGSEATHAAIRAPIRAVAAIGRSVQVEALVVQVGHRVIVRRSAQADRLDVQLAQVVPVDSAMAVVVQAPVPVVKMARVVMVTGQEPTVMCHAA
jgi:hypothetical protein